jgi:erythromycin esterase-like protein
MSSLPLRATAFFAVALLASAASAQPSTAALESPALDPAVRDACNREVVFLGEDASHGAGHTTEVKTLIIRRLVDECGFGSVVFESQFYDFLEYERTLAAGKATRQDLADAIGALWSRTREMQPLIDFLFERSSAEKIRVAGMDPQVGGVTGYYSQKRLGAELASSLPPERRATCETEFNRNHTWTYDAANPFDDAAKIRLRECGREIKGAMTTTSASDERKAAADSYARYLQMALEGDSGARDLGMFENLSWHRARWPKGTKTIVWTATSHAAKMQAAGIPWRPLGAYVKDRIGGRAIVIGFSAFSGTFAYPGGRGRANELPPPAVDWLEAKALAGDERATLRYIDPKALKGFGSTTARAVTYGKPQSLDWSTLLDGLVVLREERAAQPLP